MLLYELLDLKIDFDELEGELSSHIKKLKTDVKNVQLGMVKIVINKTKRLLKQLKDNYESDTTLVKMSNKNNLYSTQLKKIQQRLIVLKNEFEKVDFEKKIMSEVDTILINLIKDIDVNVLASDKKIANLVKVIAAEPSEKKQKKLIGKK